MKLTRNFIFAGISVSLLVWNVDLGNQRLFEAMAFFTLGIPIVYYLEWRRSHPKPIKLPQESRKFGPPKDMNVKDKTEQLRIEVDFLKHLFLLSWICSILYFLEYWWYLEQGGISLITN